MDEGVGNGVPGARRKVVTADVDGEKVQRFPLSNNSWYRAKLNFWYSHVLKAVSCCQNPAPTQDASSAKVVKIAEVALAF